MPVADRYIVYNTATKKYYNTITLEGKCDVCINNATLFNKDEYLFRRKSPNYLLANEKFVRINKDGTLKIMR